MDDFKKRAEIYNTNSSWATDVNILETTIKHINKKKIDHVLDLGAGTGILSQYISKHLNIKDITLVDSSMDMLSKVALDQKSITINNTIEEFLSHNEKKFDLIVLRQVLHYLSDPYSVMLKSLESLNNDGIIYVGQICCDTNSFALEFEKIINLLSKSRKRVFSFDSLMNFITSCDLVVENIEINIFKDSLNALEKRKIDNKNIDFYDRAKSFMSESKIKLNLNIIEEDYVYQLYFIHLFLKKYE